MAEGVFSGPSVVVGSTGSYSKVQMAHHGDSLETCLLKCLSNIRFSNKGFAAGSLAACMSLSKQKRRLLLTISASHIY